MMLIMHNSLWLLADDKDDKLRSVGPDVINGCDRQTDVAGNL